ncbi:iron complex transport system substrate-binding protein [Angulomicrobium tetraedrale]|uniref:Iron complex transport system substrate-binding protein n=1 Tax=Ancylobacter tetraedralis TaxID=217068 RepID=A0A839Z5R6_9HYPH|nr:ABC transporter substrate-binding protein [Ancylobacter tetraedralis]MBB3771019.1 iron complex transport system substrate-binding protein [Ancylobacter tetraedralis]
MPFGFSARRSSFAARLGRWLGALALGLVVQASPAIADIALKDVTGREVHLAAPAQRLLIDDGRFLIALALIHPDPVSVVAAWPRDINRIGAATFAAYQAKFPAIDSLAKVASSAGSLSVEQVVAARPDLAVFSLGSQPSDEERARIEAAGIPVVVIDFFVHPLANTEPSLRLLGAATGRTAQAEDFLAFRRDHLDAVRDALAGLTAAERPRVFLEPHAAMTADCCNSPGRGNVGEIIEAAGGTNIGAAVIPRAFGKLNLEYVIAQDPQVYIATGGSHMEGTAGLLIGPEYSPARARETLQRVISRPGFAGLAAVRDGRVHGLSHQLLNSPLDLFTVEILATWIHPERFKGLDVGETVAQVNQRFLAVPIQGPNWIDLP